MTNIFQFPLIIFYIIVSVSSLSTSTFSTNTPTLWKILQDSSSSNSKNPSKVAFGKIFGSKGERGEYMDGYSPKAMVERCIEDYGWGADNNNNIPEQRAEMMAHLYKNPTLYDYTCMVTFAEHYVLRDDDTTIQKPLQTFLQQQSQQPDHLPIFAGVVWNDWNTNIMMDNRGDEATKLEQYRHAGMAYVRLHCSLMQEMESQNDAGFQVLQELATACHQCQSHQLVPIVLLQVPWRTPNALECYQRVMDGLQQALDQANVNTSRLILETRPPIGISTQQEMDMSPEQRIALGLQTGQDMLILPMNCLGFCVAGGSTKGTNPTAMQDDCQNAVRQGMRILAKENIGYQLCYWEMGAKLLLQPQVGQLFEHDRDASQQLFCNNARAMAEEIVREL